MRIRRERAEIAGPRSPEPAQKRGDLKNSPNLGGTTKQACSRPKPGDGSIFFAPAAFWRTVERLILHSKFAGAAQHFLLLLQKKTLARQKRPRRNEPPQATSLILCAHFFLSKPQTEFAVWIFSMQICDNLSVSASPSQHPYPPFVPSGHFPLIGGIGPWKGSQGSALPASPFFLTFLPISVRIYTVHRRVDGRNSAG